MNIHSTAIVSKKAQIEEDVFIGPYCIIGDKVKIKSGTKLISHIVVDGDTSIGENNTIYPFVTLGMEPQDLKYKDEDTKLVIGDNNIIREGVTIHRGTIASGITKVGNNNIFMANSHVAHDCVVGNYCRFANVASIGGHVIVDDYAILGGLAVVHQFCKIGKHVMVAGASRIGQDVIPFITVDGPEAKVRGLNLIGLKRNYFNNGQIENIKDAYRTIFRKGLRLNEALEILYEKYHNDSNILYMIDFAKSSERGICR